MHILGKPVLLSGGFVFCFLVRICFVGFFVRLGFFTLMLVGPRLPTIFVIQILVKVSHSFLRHMYYLALWFCL